MFLHTLRVFSPPTFTMHLCITQCTYWTPLIVIYFLICLLLGWFYVPYTCMIICSNFGKKRTPFAEEVTLNHRMDPSMWTQERLTTILYLKRLWYVCMRKCVCVHMHVLMWSQISIHVCGS